MHRTPVVSATLATGVTYEVERSLSGGWSRTGVLVTGTGSAQSLRLDGFPVDAAYRFSRVGTGEIVTAAKTMGVHLAGSFAAATNVSILRSGTLATGTWAHVRHAFTGASGTFLQPWREPLGGQQFYRGFKPAAPLSLHPAGYYMADPNTGAAGFGAVADDMPAIFTNGLTFAACGAFYNRGGVNAAAAGECYEFAGPNGRVTAMVTDFSPDPPADTCDNGRYYFDLSESAFSALYPLSIGRGTVTYRLVPAPVTGNLKAAFTQGSNPYYFELRFYNHRAGIANVEFRDGGSSIWQSLPRTTYNTFVANPGGGGARTPFTIRVTSRFGEMVQFPVNAITENARIATSVQFTQFPNLDPEPVWFLPPVYTDALTSIPGGAWQTYTYGTTTLNLANAGGYQGSMSIRADLGGFGGAGFLYPSWFPVGEDDVFTFAIRSGDASAITGLTLQFRGLSGGGTANSTAVRLPTIGSTWSVIRIPLRAVQAPEQVREFVLQNSASGAAPPVLLDAISFQRF